MSVTPPSGLSPEDFDAIEGAVMETARGRWFLLEFAQRVRNTQNTGVLDAISRLEKLLAGAVPAPKDDLLGREITLIHERLYDLVWSFRERGLDDEICEPVEREARALADLFGTGVAAAIRSEVEAGDALHRAEAKATEAEAAGNATPAAATLAAPAVAVAERPAPPAPGPVAAQPPKPQAAQPAANPFAALEALSMEERLAYFV